MIEGTRNFRVALFFSKDSRSVLFFFFEWMQW